MSSRTPDLPEYRSSSKQPVIPSRPRFRTLLAAFLSTLLAFGTITGVATSASATSGTDEAVMDLYVEGDPSRLNAGEYVTVNIQLDATHVKENWTDGYQVVYQLPEGAPFAFPEHLNYGGNITSIESIERDDADPSRVIVKFKDPATWDDDDITEALAAIQMEVIETVITSEYEWQWTERGESNRVVIIAEDDEPVPSVRPQTGKSLANANIYPEIDHVNRQVILGDDYLDRVFEYTLIWDTDVAIPEAILTDELPEGMEFVGFTQAYLETWDNEIEGIGLVNKQTEDLLPLAEPAGGTITIEPDGGLPENSRLTVKYQTKLTPEKLEEIRVVLQAEYNDAITRGEEGFQFTLPIENTAYFNGEDEKSADINFGISTPSASPGWGTFGKGVDEVNKGIAEVDPETGAVHPKIPVEYTVHANLSQFTGFLELKSNAVIVDKLPAGFTLEGVKQGNDSQAITGALTPVQTAADLAAARAEVRGQAIGSYHIYEIDGDTYLLLNAGTSGNWRLELAGTFDNVADRTPSKENNTGYDLYTIRNDSDLWFETQHSNEDRSFHSSADFNFRDPFSTSPDESITDPTVFSKNAATDRVSARPGERATVVFNFGVNNDPGHRNDEVNLADVKIVDEVDLSVFDVSQAMLDEMMANANPANSVDIVLNADNQLDITLRDTWLAENPDQISLNLQIPFYTYVIQGKQSFEIENTAYLQGSERGTEYTSTTSTRASSFARELQLRKTLWDEAAGKYTNMLELPEVGAPVEFVYRIELIPHNGYGNVNIKNYQDLIPDVFDVLGFVSASDPMGTIDETSVSFDIGRGVSATWDDDKRSLSVTGRLASGDDNPIAVAFKVRVKDGVELDEMTAPIINRIGGTSATIVPSGEGYPLLAFKTDSIDPDQLITGGTFRISSDVAGFETIEDATIGSAGNLVNADGTLIRVPEAGTYTIVEIEAPANYQLAENEADRTWNVTAFNGIGFPAAIDIANDPHTYAIGDYTWIDLNNDGQQSPGEPALENVLVELLDADGNPAVDVNGEPVAPVNTNAQGRYVFDNLRAGDYQVRFTLDEWYNGQRFTFTSAETGADESDSDANVVDGSDGRVGVTEVFALGQDSELKDLDTYRVQDWENGEFTATRGIDPTWDAGVIWRTGQAAITKSFVDDQGNPLDDDAAAATFDWSAELPWQGDVVPSPALEGTITVAPGETAVIDEHFPHGTRVTFSEADEVRIPGYDFQGVTITSETITVQAGDTPATAIAVNTYSQIPTGTFTIVKELEGLDVSDLPAGTTYEVIASWELDGESDSQTFELVPGVAQDGPVLPVGTVVTFTESQGADVPGFDQAGVAITVDGDGTNELTIQDQANAEVVVTNLFTPIPTNTFSVEKVVEGGDLPADTEFTVVAQWVDPFGVDQEQIFTLLAGQPQESEPIHVGTEVTLTEVNAPEVANHSLVSVITVDGVEGNTLTVSDAASAQVVVTNTYSERQGSFTVVKELNNVADEAADGVTFEVVATWDGGSETFTLTPGVASDPITLPAGTVVTLAEPSPSHIVAHAFDSVIFTEGDAVLTDGSFVVREGSEPVAFTATNTYNPVPDPEAGYTHSKEADPASGTTVNVGDVITYTLRATNTGDAHLGEVTITDSLAGLAGKATYNGDVRALVDGVESEISPVDADQLIWVGELAPGAEVVITYSVTVVEDAQGLVLENQLTSEAIPYLPEDPADPQSPLVPGEPIVPAPETTVHPVPEPEPGKVSVGDLVWVDSNADGRQDDGEPGIPGVVLEIVGPDGEPVTDVYGNPVGPETTDENGNYLFSDLPVLEDSQSYTVRIVRDHPSTVEALEPYVPTAANVGDREGDSADWEASSQGLTVDGDADLTLDFGFVVPEPVEPGKVSVGDLVWVDSNADGRQDDGEPGIPGVVLEIVGPDGEPVTDVYGNPVGPETTDENGNYLFTDLPVLEEGQSYTVKIVRDHPSTVEALEPYVPTAANVGDREGDSSDWEASSQGLTVDGDADLTLDFGFVVPDLEPTDPEPTDPEPTDPEPTDPEPTDPEPTDPEPTDPEPTDPEPTEPEPTTPAPDKTPDTGIEPSGLVALALLAAGLGAVLLVLRRKLAV